ncbi:hypothetical protein FOA52_012785 [Chlamydomonas sp. UWO 241]|nr:hypothetical protein FOA52_012785 [Chlamydomonas sp. UWO 241]
MLQSPGAPLEALLREVRGVGSADLAAALLSVATEPTTPAHTEGGSGTSPGSSDSGPGVHVAPWQPRAVHAALRLLDARPDAAATLNALGVEPTLTLLALSARLATTRGGVRPRLDALLDAAYSLIGGGVGDVAGGGGASLTQVWRALTALRELPHRDPPPLVQLAAACRALAQVAEELGDHQSDHQSDQSSAAGGYSDGAALAGAVASLCTLLVRQRAALLAGACGGPGASDAPPGLVPLQQELRALCVACATSPAALSALGPDDARRLARAAGLTGGGVPLLAVAAWVDAAAAAGADRGTAGAAGADAAAAGAGASLAAATAAAAAAGAPGGNGSGGASAAAVLSSSGSWAAAAGCALSALREPTGGDSSSSGDISRNDDHAALAPLSESLAACLGALGDVQAAALVAAAGEQAVEQSALLLAPSARGSGCGEASTATSDSSSAPAELGATAALRCLARAALRAGGGARAGLGPGALAAAARVVAEQCCGSSSRGSDARDMRALLAAVSQSGEDAGGAAGNGAWLARLGAGAAVDAATALAALYVIDNDASSGGDVVGAPQGGALSPRALAAALTGPDGALGGVPPSALVALLRAAVAASSVESVDSVDGVDAAVWRAVAGAAARALAARCPGALAARLGAARRVQMLLAVLSVTPPRVTATEYGAGDASSDASSSSGGGVASGSGGAASGSGARTRALSLVAAPLLRRVGTTGKRLGLLQAAGRLQQQGGQGDGPAGTSDDGSGAALAATGTNSGADRANVLALAAVSLSLTSHAASLLAPHQVLRLLRATAKQTDLLGLALHVDAPGDGSGLEKQRLDQEGQQQLVEQWAVADDGLIPAKGSRLGDDSSSSSSSAAAETLPPPESDGGSSSGGGVSISGPLPAPGSLVPRLCVLAAMRLAAYGDSQVVGLLVALARARTSPGLLLRDACARLLRPTRPLPGSQLVWGVWALASLGVRKPVVASLVRSALAQAQALRTQPKGKALEPAQLATLVWACGRLGLRDDAALKPVLALLLKCEAETEALPLSLVSNVVWACARLGYSTERLSAWAVGHTGDGCAFLMAAPPRVLSHLCWGLFRLGHAAGPVLVRTAGAAGAARASELSPAEVSALLSALAGWRARPPRSLLLSIEARIAEAAEANVSSSSSNSGSGGGSDGDGMVPSINSNVATPLRPAGGVFDATTLAGCVWALVRLGHTPSRATLHAVCSAVEAALVQQSVDSGDTGSGLGPSGRNTGRGDAVSDPLIGDLLWACFKCFYTPTALIYTYSADLQARLWLVGRISAAGSIDLYDESSDGFGDGEGEEGEGGEWYETTTEAGAAGALAHLDGSNISAVETDGGRTLAGGSGDGGDGESFFGEDRFVGGDGEPAATVQSYDEYDGFDGFNMAAADAIAERAAGRSALAPEVRAALMSGDGDWAEWTGSGDAASDDEAASIRSAPASSSCVALGFRRSRHQRLRAPGAGSVAAAALGLSLHGVRDPALALQLEMAAISVAQGGSGFSSPQLSRLLHGLARMGHVPRVWFSAGLPRALRRALPGMTLPQLARCVSALGQWPLHQLLPQAEARHLTHQVLAPALDAAAALAADARPGDPAAPRSASLMIDLITGCSSMGLYRRPLVEVCLAWLTAQPADASSSSSSSGSSDSSGSGSSGSGSSSNGSPPQDAPASSPRREPAVSAGPGQARLPAAGAASAARTGAAGAAAPLRSGQVPAAPAPSASAPVASAPGATVQLGREPAAPVPSASVPVPSAPAAAQPAPAPIPFRLLGLTPDKLASLAGALATLKHDGGGAALAAVSAALLAAPPPGGASLSPSISSLPSTSGGDGAVGSAAAFGGAAGSGVGGDAGAPDVGDVRAAAVPASSIDGDDASPASASAALGGGAPGGAPSSLFVAPALRSKELNRLAWAWAKLNRHPGATLLEAATDRWEAATVGAGGGAVGSGGSGGSGTADQGEGAAASGGSSAGVGVSSGGCSSGCSATFAEVCTVLWSLALLREHNGRWAQLCARQLAGMLDAHARGQEERAQQRRQRQQEQQQERQQAATGSEAEGAGEAAQQGARQRKLPPEFVRQLRQVAAVLLAAQAERLESPLVSALSPDVRAAALDAWRSHIARKSTKRPGRHIFEVAASVERMGLTPRARGYIVVPVSCDQWDAMVPDLRCLYLQEKLDSRLVAAAAAAAAAARVAGPAGPADADADDASGSGDEERVGLWRRSAPRAVTSSSARAAAAAAARPPPFQAARLQPSGEGEA